MADTKISGLTAATSLADTDELVIASSGASKKITGANLKASANLDNLADVQAPTPSDEQALVWDAGASKWVAKTAILHIDANAKGDLFAASANDVVARLAVGSNDQVLVADSSQTTGVKWAAVPSGSGGAMTLLSTTTLGAGGTFDVSSISGGYNDLLVVLMVRGTNASTTEILAARFNNDSAANYGSQYVQGSGSSAQANTGNSETSMNVANNIGGGNAAAGVFSPVYLSIIGYASTTWNKAVMSTSAFVNDITAGGRAATQMTCLWKSTAAVNRIQVFGRGTANLATGSQMRIYGIT